MTSQRRVFLTDLDKLPAWNWTSAKKKKKKLMNVITSGCFSSEFLYLKMSLIVFLALCGRWTETEGTLKKRLYASFIVRLRLHSEWNFISIVKNKVKKIIKNTERITHLNLIRSSNTILSCVNIIHTKVMFPPKLWNQFLSVEYEVLRDNFSVP